MSEELRLRPSATFSGLRGVPLVALSHNALWPELVVGQDGATIRVLFRHRLRFDAIEEVRMRWRLAHQLTIVPRRGWRSFSANFMAKGEARRALEAFARHGVPLDAEAEAFLRTTPPSL